MAVHVFMFCSSFQAPSTKLMHALGTRHCKTSVEIVERCTALRVRASQRQNVLNNVHAHNLRSSLVPILDALNAFKLRRHPLPLLHDSFRKRLVQRGCGTKLHKFFCYRILLEHLLARLYSHLMQPIHHGAAGIWTLEIALCIHCAPGGVWCLGTLHKLHEAAPASEMLKRRICTAGTSAVSRHVVHAYHALVVELQRQNRQRKSRPVHPIDAALLDLGNFHNCFCVTRSLGNDKVDAFSPVL
mmetsp:Transcript_8143/g.15460  ORF Transcript_8143/g.15460 Transcript_8143/m.15460 type:complete len:243 (-) Transcript_8143:1244-1972(-)